MLCAASRARGLPWRSSHRSTRPQLRGTRPGEAKRRERRSRLRTGRLHAAPSSEPPGQRCRTRLARARTRPPSRLAGEEPASGRVLRRLGLGPGRRPPRDAELHRGGALRISGCEAPSRVWDGQVGTHLRRPRGRPSQGLGLRLAVRPDRQPTSGVWGRGGPRARSLPG